MEKQISVRGARTHNLKNISVDIPHNKLTVITGLSGSGKSSLAFDTVYAEGQRRYIESLSTYARQFLELMEKPDADEILGVSPSIAIEQKNIAASPRSTVGTMTEIYDFIRLLFARTGTPVCPEHGISLKASSPSQIVDEILLTFPVGTKLMITAPVGEVKPEQIEEKIKVLRTHGYTRFRLNGEIFTDMDEYPQDEGKLETVVDRIKIHEDSRSRVADSVETALLLGEGQIRAIDMESGKEIPFSEKFACPYCGFTMELLEPKFFSFNSPQGACPVCSGTGETEQFDPEKIITDQSKSLSEGALSGWTPKDPTNWELITALAKKLKFSLKTPWKKLKPEDKEAILYGTPEKIPVSYLNADGQTEIVEQPFEGVIPTMERRWKSTDNKTVRSHLAQFRSELPCPACHGSRINEKVKCVHVGEGKDRKNIAEISDLPLSECYKYFKALKLTGSAAEPAEKLKQEILNRLLLLNQLGLGYLTLSRSSLTLSGGEAQRIRLSSQISSKLTGVTYVLDEPSIGLHQHDKNKLIGALDNLKKLGNTVIVVEHDEDTMDFADWIIDMGPAAGIGGGEVCAAGTPEEIKKNPDSLTGQYLSGQLKVRTPSKILPHNEFLTIKGARGHNLKNIDVSIPIGLMTVVTGVSGSGKSSLVNGTISALARARLNGAKTHPLPFDSIEGLEYFDKVIHVDQSPIGRTPRSNPATYTGVFQYIRDLFAETAIAKERGYGSNRFSFNMKGGRCEACEGEGQIKVEMNFLPDMYVPCDVCHGTRYNRETLDVVYKGYNIAQVLDMSVSEALVLFKNVPAITRKLKTLQDVGLGYIKLGQSASTLSGGEAQRVRLAQELSRKGTGKTLYILDEPTSGLHFKDIDVLIGVLEKLRDAGNTILLIEHNMDMIRAADWIVDLGPEGGDAGGQVIACGTPQQVMKIPESKTGKCLLESA